MKSKWPFQEAVSGTPASLTWQSSDNNITTVNNGLVTTRSIGSCGMTVTDGVHIMQNVVVDVVPDSITLSKTPVVSLNFGDNDIETAGWSVDSNKVITIQGDGGYYLKLTVSSYNSSSINISQVMEYDPGATPSTRTATNASTGCDMGWIAAGGNPATPSSLRSGSKKKLFTRLSGVPQ